MSRVRATIAMALILASGAGYLVLAQQPPMLSPKADADVSVLMRAKLSSSQKVVEGLTSSDFDMIRKGAEDLQKICDSNSWRRGDDQVIGHYRSELRRAAMKLLDQATEQNLDGAAYTYMHTLSTCINCHQYTRAQLRVAGTGKSGAGTAAVVPIPVTERENAAYQARNLYR